MSRINIKNYYRLTEPQKRIYISESLNPGTSIGNLCASYYLENKGDYKLLSEAINQVIQRNDGMRLQISIIEGVAFQYIVPFEKIEFEVIEVTDHKKWKTGFSRASFELIENRLFNIALFYDENEHLSFIINIHHIISDAWTHDSLAKQILSVYKSLMNHETLIFDKPGSYLEYIYNEEQYMTSPRFLKSEKYWDDQFKNINTDRIFSDYDNKVKKSKRYEYYYTKEVSSKINNFCSENHISIPNFFLAVLSLSIRFFTDNRNYIIGTLIHNRLGKKEKKVTGMFVNTLPILFNINKEDSFFYLVNDIALKMTGLIRNQRFPLNKIQNIPELEIIYTYENIEFPLKHELHFSGYELFPLLLRASCRGDNQCYKLEIDYHKNKFRNEDIDNFQKYYNTILYNVISSKDCSIDSLYKKEYSSLKQFYKSMNATERNYNLENTLHGIFEKSVIKYGEKKAISYNNTRLSYSELNQRANFVANLLLEMGCSKESPVVLVMDRSLEMMISILAVLKAGCCYLPVSPEQPLARIEKLIHLSKSNMVIYNNDIVEDLYSNCNKIDIRSISYSDITKILNLNLDIDPNNLAYIIYTSGSTGEPKGVMLEHKAVINRLFWMQDKYSIEENDVLLQKTPYTFDVSVWELFWWFFNGSALHFLNPGEEKEPEAIINAIDRHGITNIHFVPSMLSLFLEYIEKIGSVERIKNLKRVICSGEALSTVHVNNFAKLISNVNKATIHNLYGPTEAAIDVTYYDCVGNESDFVPIGKPVSNVQLFVLNKEGDLLPPGKVGELHISGVCLARGYFNRQDLTREKFIYNEELNLRMYKTGDLATFLDDGNIKYLGRIDSQVKIRGNRVELGEIETCISKFPGIIDVAVNAPVDESGNAFLGAYYISNKELSHENLRHYIQRDLPSYMIPSFFIRMDFFPLTNNGKLNRKLLPLPESRNNVGKTYKAPINDREEEICEIWEDILKTEKIGRNENFFDLGGDSLMLIKVHFALQEKYDVSLQDLFEYQTIESLSQHIHQKNKNIISFNNEEYIDMVNRWNSAFKLKAYLTNDRNSEMSNNALKNRDDFKNILITGSTGFLGIYVVREYLENTNSFLYLLVRGNSDYDAEIRFYNIGESYFGVDFFNKYKKRIKIISGDIALDDLGNKYLDNIGNHISCVIHCAANVRHYGKKEKVFAVNVTGTKNVVSFCNKYSSKLVHISTMSVAFSKITQKDCIYFTENEELNNNITGNVYIDSKIEAEKIIQKNMEYCSWEIIRVGNVVNDSKTGKFQLNKSENAFVSSMLKYKENQQAPNIDIPFIDLSYVNETAEGIRLLSYENGCKIFHLFNPNTITLEEICRVTDIEMIVPKNFIENLQYGDLLTLHGYYLKDIKLLGIIPLCDFTLKILSKNNFKWRRVNDNLLRIFWENWQKSRKLVMN